MLLAMQDLGRRDLVSRYWSDLFTTLLDSSWKMVLFLTMLVYVSHWIIFGLIYWVFAVINKDSSTTEDPCVFNVYNFVSAFLYSMESETTIGSFVSLYLCCFVLRFAVNTYLIREKWIVFISSITKYPEMKGD